MAALEISRSVEIERSADVVRAQFGDVQHHAVTSVHKGVEFEVLEDGDQCRYRQVSSVGPLKFEQVFVLDRSDEGPLVNRIVQGQFSGGAITFRIEPLGASRSRVDAELAATVSGLLRVAAPVLRAQVGRQLAAALLEDKADLESRAYDRASGTELP